jgi:hypothetical protein
MFLVARGEVTQKGMARKVMRALHLENPIDADLWISLFHHWEDGWTDLDYRGFVDQVAKIGIRAFAPQPHDCVAAMNEGDAQRSLLVGAMLRNQNLKFMVAAMEAQDIHAFFSLYPETKKQWGHLMKKRRS